MCSTVSNCVTEFCPRAWNQQRSCSSGRVYSPGKLRGHKSTFLRLSFWLQKTALICWGIPPAAALFSPGPRCMSSTLPFGDETCAHFSHHATGGGWYKSNTALISHAFINLSYLKAQLYIQIFVCACVRASRRVSSISVYFGICFILVLKSHKGRTWRRKWKHTVVSFFSPKCAEMRVND